MARTKGRDFLDGKIKSGEKIYALAPLAGYSDVGMRALCMRFGADYTVTEMVSAKALVYGSNNTRKLLETAPEEKVLCVQLFGREPEFIAKAVRLPELDKFDIIDFNFGCPMRKIVSNGEGSALMKEPETIYKIIKSAVEVSDGRPITAKIRTGYDEQSKNAVEVAQAVQQGGASLITVHGRTREQLYNGLADRNIIKAVKASVKIPVIANGDVVDKASADAMLKETGADGIAIGRGAVGRPFIFTEVKGGVPEYEIYELIRTHFERLNGLVGTKTAINDMKKHLVAYVKGFQGASSIRDAVMNASTIEGFLEIVERIKDIKIQ